MRRFLALCSALTLFATSAIAQQALVIRPLAERKVADLPTGPTACLNGAVL